MSENLPPQQTQPSEETCPYCGAISPSAANYCPRCGAMKPRAMYMGLPPAGDRRAPFYYQPVRHTNIRLALKTVSTYVMITFIAQLVVSIVVLVYGVTEVVPRFIDTGGEYTLFLIVPVIVGLVTLSGATLLAYYLFLIVSIVASCAWVILSSVEGFGKELRMKGKSREHSPLFDTLGLMFATLFFSTIAALIANPSMDDGQGSDTLADMLFLLANFSVWEEIAVRLILIGVPLFFVDVARKARGRRWHNYILGGGMPMGVPESVLLIVSSAIFGIAHFAGGWGAWKIIPASVGGLAFGYLFLRHGIAASITMHFGTDYLALPSEVSGSFALTLLTGIGILLWLGFGLVFFTYYSTRVVEFFSGKKLFEPRAQPAAPAWGYPQMPPPYYGPPTQPVQVQQYVPPAPGQPVQSWFTTGYVCPVCGYAQARWVEGRLQCLRCGHLT